jgi:hypothetical protein
VGTGRRDTNATVGANHAAVFRTKLFVSLIKIPLIMPAEISLENLAYSMELSPSSEAASRSATQELPDIL